MTTIRGIEQSLQYYTDINNQVIEVGDIVAHISAILDRGPMTEDGRTGRGVVIKIKHETGRIQVRHSNGSTTNYSPTTLRILKKKTEEPVKGKKQFRIIGRI